MRLRTTLGAAAAVVGLGVSSFGGVSLALTGDEAPDTNGAPTAEGSTDLDATWDTLDACLEATLPEPAEAAPDDDWEAFEAAADAAWEECVSTLTPEQQAAIEADEEVWAGFEECLDANVDWEAEPADDVAESEWREFGEQIFAAEKACADQLPEDARIEFDAGIANEEAWMAFDQCIVAQGAPTGEPALDAPHSDWLAFEGQWEVAEEACIDLMPEDEWCEETGNEDAREEGNASDQEDGDEPDENDEDDEA